MSKTDGGPAFPHWDGPTGQCFNGMSLRDYFAAAALTLSGVAAAARADRGDVPDVGMIGATAAIAYEIADAMLAERDK